MKLTEKQKRFCDFYIETGNATEAARLAGYSGRNLNRIGYENLSKLDIQIYIKERNNKLEEERIANIREVKIFWTSILRDESADIKDRLKASEFIAKTNAAFKDKIEYNGKVKTEYEESRRTELEERLEQDPQLQHLYMKIWEREQLSNELNP
ncbi:terminase small subunit [Bacillus thermotolerans]|uniref:terminase small subunit n=1 Tax=Bacillus thermotolerans TaxID=1221996 RepID=UPI0005835290|nr:terminase small subunit [Bacillus thermotolerans]KKB33787.1 Phage terminase, small subunit [Bacillus thermotolerans]